MTIIELLLIAVGLSMDAFAVSICKGLSAGKPKASNYFTVAVWFGGFQALMPFIGYLLGSTFERYITAVDHWVAFILLVLIGGNMIREALAGDSCDTHANGSFAPRAMLLLAVATSIDSLAVGITFALLPGVNIAAAVLLIGCRRPLQKQSRAGRRPHSGTHRLQDPAGAPRRDQFLKKQAGGPTRRLT